MQRDPHDPLDVLLILGAFQLRGSYSRALSLINKLPPKQVHLKLLATGAVQPGLMRSPPPPQIVYPSLNWPVIGRVTRRWVRTDLQVSPPDLIDVQHRRMLPLAAWLARRLQRPYIVTVHDYLREREPFPIDRQWCRKIIAVSESVRSELLVHVPVPEDLVCVLPSGVQPPDESELSDILPSDRAPVIGTAGPLESGKGLRHFLRAAAIVLKTFPDASFVIAGSGPEEGALRRLAEEIEITHAVTILPNLRDFDPALAAMDIFVLPALKQGLGTTLLQAMSRGIPVIATEAGGVYSVVSDGITGLLVPPSDEVLLARRLLDLLHNPEMARKLGEQARQRVLEHFHVDGMIEATLRLYREVTDE